MNIFTKIKSWFSKKKENKDTSSINMDELKSMANNLVWVNDTPSKSVAEKVVEADKSIKTEKETEVPDYAKHVMDIVPNVDKVDAPSCRRFKLNTNTYIRFKVKKFVASSANSITEHLLFTNKEMKHIRCFDVNVDKFDQPGQEFGCIFKYKHPINNRTYWAIRVYNKLYLLTDTQHNIGWWRAASHPKTVKHPYNLAENNSVKE